MPSLARWIALQRPQYRSGGLFLPSDVSGLQLWLDPDSGLADPTWTARAGPNATLVDGPTINAADANFNGKKSITFNGTSEYITADAVGGVIDGDDTPFVVVSVARFISFAGAIRIIWCAGRSNSSSDYQFQGGNTTTGADRIDRDDTSSAASSALGTPEASVDTTYIYVQRYNGTTVDLWRNGTKVMDAASLDKLSIAWDQYTIGAFRRSTVSNFFDGTVAEHLVYQPNPTIAQLNQVQSYLAAKYNLSVTALA